MTTAKDVVLAYKNLFSSLDGKMVLSDLAQRCGRDRSPFVSGDTHRTAANIGRGEVFCEIMQILAITDLTIFDQKEEGSILD